MICDRFDNSLWMPSAIIHYQSLSLSESLLKMHAELEELEKELERAEEALGYYNGLRIEVIRDCGGGMCNVPHRINLNDTAREYFEEKLKREEEKK